jgi:hypothetical protein
MIANPTQRSSANKRSCQSETQQISFVSNLFTEVLKVVVDGYECKIHCPNLSPSA